ncbi:MAG: Zn-ribbon domain-containing OB-fold protein [Candidatus Bathyarchaeota archaeon]|nr:MAG: Zn-ribbon domain-containing OB-fold protein [Candidatus Bathyarchaeota archaeon]
MRKMPELPENVKQNIREEGLPIVLEPKTRLPLYISVRELSLRYQFGTTKIQKFFEGLKEGRIYMTQCKKCGQKFFPPQGDCPICIESDVRWIPLNGEGELLTCTMILVKPPTYAHHDNYIVGIAKMKEGVRVLAWLKIDDPKKIKPKMKVRLETVKREPEQFITYEFTPI